MCESPSRRGPTVEVIAIGVTVTVVVMLTPLLNMIALWLAGLAGIVVVIMFIVILIRRARSRDAEARWKKIIQSQGRLQVREAEVYADIIEWEHRLHDVISDDAAAYIAGDFAIENTIHDGDALRDEILRKGSEHGHPPELAALLGWVYFYQISQPVLT